MNLIVGDKEYWKWFFYHELNNILKQGAQWSEKSLKSVNLVSHGIITEFHTNFVEFWNSTYHHIVLSRDAPIRI